MEYYLVLGCKHISDTIARVQKLHDMLQFEKNKIVVLLSGTAKEVQDMCDWINTEIPPQFVNRFKLVFDTHASNTVENLLLLERRNIEYANIITSDYHADRVEKILNCMGRYDDMLFTAATNDAIVRKTFQDFAYRIMTVPITVSALRKVYVVKHNLRKLLRRV